MDPRQQASCLVLHGSGAPTEVGTPGRLLVFGGCLDQSTFLSLVARNYVQTREMWCYDMTRLK